MTNNVLVWIAVLLLAGTTAHAQPMGPVSIHPTTVLVAGPLSESLRHAAATLARNPVGSRSASAQTSQASHNRCANAVMLGAALGAGAGLGVSYALVGPQGSDSARAILGAWTIAGAGLGALIGSRACH